jgi:geranyl-CoA carboxylase alpha subunit
MKPQHKGLPDGRRWPFDSVLVANRGEIACRVFRSAQRLGLRTVAVFSDADADALHVRTADSAVRIGPAPASQSYLQADALIDAARRSGAQAIHPGYGFLSENASFAEACAQAGLAFIGPPPSAIRAMGSKAQAKARMLAAGVPCVPGTLGEVQDDASLTEAAQRIGYPLLVKAVAGGGGRGIRLVTAAADLPAALAGARREAESAFGDGMLMLEKLIRPARHIEVQVFADTQGRCIHLGERDCSTQRRRQKVIEESPSPVVSPALREAMGASALAAAQAVGYVGAGTVEFIVDEALNHYFLEMNTRLQVEHPVTEMCTGLDLVEWQLRVAAGEALPLAQHEVRHQGHAIEARLYAEDPAQGWRPQTGRYHGWRPHPGDAHLRIDHGLNEVGEVGPHYDAMLAKFIAHGATRADAVRQLQRGLRENPLFGLRHNAGFLHQLLGSDAFLGAQLRTHTLDDSTPAAPPVPELAWRLAAAWLAMPASGSLRSASVASYRLSLSCAGQTRSFAVPVPGVEGLHWAQGRLVATVDGVQRQCPASAGQGSEVAELGAPQRRGLSLAFDAEVFEFSEVSPWPHAPDAQDPRRALAPVAGTLVQLLVQPGQAVHSGQPLACVEAMKMELWLHAQAAGRVTAVHAQTGQPVAAGSVVVELELSADSGGAPAGDADRLKTEPDESRP